jgi:hypothetical protein
MQREDVRVLEIRGGLYLGQKSFRADHGGQFGLQDLQGNLSFVLEVVSQIYRRHPALTELTLNSVTVGECGLQALLVFHL